MLLVLLIVFKHNLLSHSKQGYIKSLGEQWREKRNLPINRYKRFTYGVYSIKRHTSNDITYEYVDPPSQSLKIDIEDQSSCSSSGDNEIGCVQEVSNYVLHNKLIYNYLLTIEN